MVTCSTQSQRTFLDALAGTGASWRLGGLSPTLAWRAASLWTPREGSSFCIPASESRSSQTIFCCV